MVNIHIDGPRDFFTAGKHTLIIIKSGLSFPTPYLDIGTGPQINYQHKFSRGKDQVKNQFFQTWMHSDRKNEPFCLKESYDLPNIFVEINYFTGERVMRKNISHFSASVHVTLETSGLNSQG